MCSENRSNTIVHIIAGFLGSGKTTLLRRILQSYENLLGTAVIVNEFGTVGIDGTLIAEDNVKVIELVNGCICCTLSVDLASTFEMLSRQRLIQRVFVEATGLAEPSAIWRSLEIESKRTWIRRGVTVGVLDGRMWKARHHIGSFFLDQLRNVDVIILNKLDLLGGTQIADILKEIRSEVGIKQVIPAIYCDVNPLKILKKCFESVNGSKERFQKQHDFAHYEYRSKRTLLKQCVGNVFRNLKDQVFRAKGPVRLPGQTLLLNYSGGIISWEKWPRSETTCIVIIGRSIDFAKIKVLLDSCQFDVI